MERPRPPSRRRNTSLSEHDLDCTHYRCNFPRCPFPRLHTIRSPSPASGRPPNRPSRSHGRRIPSFVLPVFWLHTQSRLVHVWGTDHPSCSSCWPSHKRVSKSHTHARPASDVSLRSLCVWYDLRKHLASHRRGELPESLIYALAPILNCHHCQQLRQVTAFDFRDSYSAMNTDITTRFIFLFRSRPIPSQSLPSCINSPFLPSVVRLQRRSVFHMSATSSVLILPLPRRAECPQCIP